MTNLSQKLTESASMYPDHPAVRMDDHVLTYAALDDAASRMVTLLRGSGLEPGDRVGLMLPNVQFAISYYGILRAGGVVVPMNPLLKARDVEYYLRDSGAKLLLAWHDCAAEAEAGAKAAGPDCLAVAPGDWDFQAALAATPPATDPVSRSDDDIAVILYTSGTTGNPKGAELTHGGLNRNQAVTARAVINAARVLSGELIGTRSTPPALLPRLPTPTSRRPVPVKLRQPQRRVQRHPVAIIAGSLLPGAERSP